MHKDDVGPGRTEIYTYQHHSGRLMYVGPFSQEDAPVVGPITFEVVPRPRLKRGYRDPVPPECQCSKCQEKYDRQMAQAYKSVKARRKK